MEHRPFPPSPRRAALARAAGLVPASPVAVAAVAWLGALLAAVATARPAARMLGDWLAAACRGNATLAAAPAALVRAVATIAGPVLVAAALAGAIAQLAQTRALWLPRRNLPGAPALADDPGTRLARAARELAGGAIALAVVIAWLWAIAPRLAVLPSLAAGDLLGAGAALLASAAAALGVAWVALGAIDAGLAWLAHARALAMTAADKREDDRLAGADPRWRARRAAAARSSTADAIAGASVVVLGDDLAVAIAWHPVLRPLPTRVALGHRALATQLLGLARRHRIAIHRDAALATALAAAPSELPRALWPRVAELVSASSAGRS